MHDEPGLGKSQAPRSIDFDAQHDCLWSSPATSYRIEAAALRHLWNHAAFEHFVGDGSRYFVDERNAHLWVAPQESDGSLLHLPLWLALFLPQLLAGRILVPLDDFVGNPVHDREFLSSGKSRQEQCRYD